MLTLEIPPLELWDEEIQKFVDIPGKTIKLEHSLVSISKWESKYHKPLLSNEERTPDELLDYIFMMIITQNVNTDELTYALTGDVIKKINDYMGDSMTATTFANVNDKAGGVKRQKVITNEVIYGWMFSYSIPKECEKWHISRLLTLIRVCEVQNRGPQDIDPKKAAKRNAELNRSRLKGGKAG